MNLSHAVLLILSNFNTNNVQFSALACSTKCQLIVCPARALNYAILPQFTSHFNQTAKSNEHSTDGPKYYSNPKMERLTKLKSLLKYGLNNHAKMIVFKLVAIASFESTTCLLVIKMCYDFSTGKSRFGSFIRNMN
jgi:hypothetical protein